LGRRGATREAIARREPLIYKERLSVHELLSEPSLLRFEHGGCTAIDIKSGSGRRNGTEEEAKQRERPLLWNGSLRAKPGHVHPRRRHQRRGSDGSRICQLGTARC
jgi:hypothetical protein